MPRQQWRGFQNGDPGSENVGVKDIETGSKARIAELRVRAAAGEQLSDDEVQELISASVRATTEFSEFEEDLARVKLVEDQDGLQVVTDQNGPEIETDADAAEMQRKEFLSVAEWLESGGVLTPEEIRIVVRSLIEERQKLAWPQSDQFRELLALERAIRREIESTAEKDMLDDLEASKAFDDGKERRPRILVERPARKRSLTEEQRLRIAGIMRRRATEVGGGKAVRYALRLNYPNWEGGEIVPPESGVYAIEIPADRKPGRPKVVSYALLALELAREYILGKQRGGTSYRGGSKNTPRKAYERFRSTADAIARAEAETVDKVDKGNRD